MHLDDIHELSVCSDCIMLAANGETPVNMNEEETAEYIARVETHTAGLHVAAGGEDLGFCKSACDMCGTRLAGDRFAASGFPR